MGLTQVKPPTAREAKAQTRLFGPKVQERLRPTLAAKLVLRSMQEAPVIVREAVAEGQRQQQMAQMTQQQMMAAQQPQRRK